MAKKPKNETDGDTDADEDKHTEAPSGTAMSHEYTQGGEPVSVTEPGDHSADNKSLPAEQFHPEGDVAQTEKPPAWLSPTTLDQTTGPGVPTDHQGQPEPGTATEPGAMTQSGARAPYGEVMVPYQEAAPATTTYPLEDGEPPMPEHIRFHSGHPQEFVAWLKEFMGWRTGAPPPEDKKTEDNTEPPNDEHH